MGSRKARPKRRIANLSVGRDGQLRVRASQREPAGAFPRRHGESHRGSNHRIGFIGGGAILKQGNSVHGTATAASLWATGAIGVSVGLGSFDVAVTVAVFTFLTLRLLTLVKDDDDDVKSDRT